MQQDVAEKLERRIDAEETQEERRPIRRTGDGDFGEAARTKARVVGKQNASGGVFVPMNVVGDCARDTAHIFKGKICS